MTQQEMTIDKLYDEAFDALQRLEPVPLKDFAQVGTWSSVTIQVQALRSDFFSIRIVESDLARPFYVQGSKTQVLFNLRSNIKNVMDSIHAQEEPWTHTMTGKISKPDGTLTQEDLDALFADFGNDLPKGLT